MIYRREDARQLGFSCPYDEVAEEPLVLTIDRFVEQLDLGGLHARYSEAGTGYYDPAMMLKVWFFAYCDRRWHSRQVAQRVQYDVRYRYFVGSHRPDFRTLNRFRKDHLDLLPGHFAALVAHCEELGLIDSSVVALDGTKLRANASGGKRGRDTLHREISRRLSRDAEADGLEEGAPVDPSEPETSVSSGRATDPDARLMKTDGVVRPCYNAQVVVDNHQIIVAAEVNDHTNDKWSLPPLLDQVGRRLSSEVGAIVADAGYYSARNVKVAQERGWDVYMPKERNGRKIFGQEQFVYDAAGDRYRCPNGHWLARGRHHYRQGVLKTFYRSTISQCRDCPLKAQCTRERFRSLEIAETYVYERELAAKLSSPRGQAIHARRRELVEPVFGNIKSNLGFTRFSLRGLTNVNGEFLLVCIAHNLKKLAKWQGYRGVQAAFIVGIRSIRVRLSHSLTKIRLAGTIVTKNHSWRPVCTI